MNPIIPFKDTFSVGIFDRKDLREIDDVDLVVFYLTRLIERIYSSEKESMTAMELTTIIHCPY